jgi:DNA-binding transcriptional ArsR family regulator
VCVRFAKSSDALAVLLRQVGMDSTQNHPKRPALSDEVINLIAAHFKVVSEPHRIRLLELLSRGSATVGELSDRFLTTTPQNVSKHLNVLFQAGMLSRRQEGNAVRYELVDWTGWWVVEQIGQAVGTRRAL